MTIGILAILVLVININQPSIFTVLTSIAIIMIYVAYLMVTAPMLLRRFQGRWPTPERRDDQFFTMGRWGLPVNIVAVVWGAGMALNLAWPRTEVYGAGWYNTWGAFIYIGAIAGVGLICYFLVGRQGIGTLTSHATAPTTNRTEPGETETDQHV